MNTNTTTIRPIHRIASEAIMDMEAQARAKGKYWRHMFPYLHQYADAMLSLDTLEDKYMFDSGYGIVGGFLSNCSTWRGETAKRIKVELRQMMGLKR